MYAEHSAVVKRTVPANGEYESPSTGRTLSDRFRELERDRHNQKLEQQKNQKLQERELLLKKHQQEQLKQQEHQRHQQLPPQISNTSTHFEPNNKPQQRPIKSPKPSPQKPAPINVVKRLGPAVREGSTVNEHSHILRRVGPSPISKKSSSPTHSSPVKRNFPQSVSNRLRSPVERKRNVEVKKRTGVSKTDLDSDLDAYMYKNEDVAAVKLNDDLDEYMALMEDNQVVLVE